MSESDNEILYFYEVLPRCSSFRKFILISYLYSAFACILHFLYQSLLVHKDLHLIALPPRIYYLSIW